MWWGGRRRSGTRGEMTGARADARELVAPCEQLDWDSELFGFPVAQVRGNRLRPRSVAAIEQWCREEGIRCLYLLADFDDPQTAQLAAEHGFEVVDVRLTFRHQLDDLGGRPWHSPGPVTVREASPDELPALSAMAGRDYGTRFLFDERFPRDRCDRLYAAWIERGLRDPSRLVLVPEIGGEPVGSQVVLMPNGDGDEGRLELLTIGEHGRGQGAGTALVASAVRLLAERGASSAVTNIPARNVASVRLHERVGFRCDGVATWHHRWFGDPDAA